MHVLLLLVLGLLTHASGCGLRQDGDGFRIVSGRLVTRCSLQPWAVFLRNTANSALCTASIIGRQWILTAAHCMRRQSRNDSSPDPSKVFAYTGNIIRYKGIKREGSEVHIYPTYDDIHLYDDIALMKLRHPITFDRCQQPVCLGYYKSLPRTTWACSILGWGAKYQGGPTSSELSWKNDWPSDQAACVKIYGRNTTSTRGRYLCGTKREGFCHGDSGGPFICQHDDKRWHQYGVVSGLTSPGCGGVPGLYMRVTYFYDWIHKITGIA